MIECTTKTLYLRICWSSCKPFLKVLTHTHCLLHQLSPPSYHSRISTNTRCQYMPYRTDRYTFVWYCSSVARLAFTCQGSEQAPSCEASYLNRSAPGYPCLWLLLLLCFFLHCNHPNDRGSPLQLTRCSLQHCCEVALTWLFRWLQCTSTWLTETSM